MCHCLSIRFSVQNRTFSLFFAVTRVCFCLSFHPGVALHLASSSSSRASVPLIFSFLSSSGRRKERNDFASASHHRETSRRSESKFKLDLHPLLLAYAVPLSFFQRIRISRFSRKEDDGEADDDDDDDARNSLLPLDSRFLFEGRFCSAVAAGVLCEKKESFSPLMPGLQTLTHFLSRKFTCVSLLLCKNVPSFRRI